MSQWHVKGCPGNPLTPPPHTHTQPFHTPKPFCMYAHTHWSDNEKKWLLSSFHLILFVSFQGRSCIFSLPSWSLSFVTSKTFLCQPPALLSASPFSAPWDTHIHIYNLQWFRTKACHSAFKTYQGIRDGVVVWIHKFTCCSVYTHT